VGWENIEQIDKIGQRMNEAGKKKLKRSVSGGKCVKWVNARGMSQTGKTMAAGRGLVRMGKRREREGRGSITGNRGNRKTGKNKKKKLRLMPSDNYDQLIGTWARGGARKGGKRGMMGSAQKKLRKGIQ